ncbi:MAG: RsfS/YbeB/iojap family protein, partial [Spirochaetaceae bacterium]
MILTVNTAKNREMKEIVSKLALLLDDHKAENTVVLYVGEQCNYTDFFIITTAKSSRHLQSLAENA